MAEHVPLERDEMVRILEGIARGGSDAARIQAIKTLIGLERGEVDEDDLERLLGRR